MDQSTPQRTTLKLKTAPRKPAREVKTAPLLPQTKSATKPGAAWSDEFKRQMQADMDALHSR
jgi:hypothetical protein